MQITSRLTNRLRLTIIAGVTLIPLISVVAVVFVSTSFPIYRTMDNIVYESVEEMMPLVYLGDSTYRAAMSLHDNLIEGNSREVKAWQEASKKVDEHFDTAIAKMTFPEEVTELNRLKILWTQRKIEGEGIISATQERSSHELYQLMKQFDDGIYTIIDGIRGMHDEMHHYINHEYKKAQTMRTNALLITLATLIISLLMGISASLFLTRDRRKLVTETEQDVLTGIHNRRAFEEIISNIDESSQLTPSDHYSLIMMDIDDFKVINDQYGHQSGDNVLRHFTTHVNASLREGDFFARWGGEEFVMLLPNTEKFVSRIVAERIRKNIETSMAADTKNSPISYTVSIGVASYPDDGQQTEKVIEAADRALYRAKQSGKNRVISAGESL
ncbi:MAG: GGDEF domain-containing protein, partial [Gammaproteobacteria bacterium]|nr:GGDEF domain-containing protein [Gammaproteobacteria bacterium]